MQYGAYLVYIFFTLLMVFWGRSIAQSNRAFLTKLLIVSAIFVFFALGGERWQELWILLWPQWALAFGFVLGIVPRWFSGISLPENSRRKTRAYQKQAAEDLQRQKEAAEADLRRQEREAAERVRRQHAQAQEDLRRQAEQMRTEAKEQSKRQQSQQRTQSPPPPKSEPPKSHDPHSILGVSRSASPDEIKSAYRKLATKYHPDKAAAATPEIQKLAEEKFRAIKEAYDTLTTQR